MNTPEWIAYVGPFPFPWGQAGSRRMCGMVRSLAEAGKVVVVGGGDALPNDYENLAEGEPVGSVRYIGLGESPEKGASVLKKSIRIFLAWGSRTVAWLDAQPVKPSHVFVYGGSAQYMLRLLPWCRKHKVKLIADVVEWYDPRQLSGGTFGPFNLSAKFALKYLYPKCDGVVAISSLLERHYSNEGCPAVRVPPTLDVRGYKLLDRDLSVDSSRLTLVYAGTPGNKDLLGNVIAGVDRIDPQGTRVRLLVMGPTLEQVKALLQGRDIPPSVQVLGRVPQSEVARYITTADFSVLLREPARFANAGFPTKFVESLANGTPVIANLTSDLGFYLHEGIEGLVCADHSVDAFVDALNRALALTSEQRLLMRKAARQQAETAFDFRAYADELSRFLQKI
jgi:glycosyltransferase involved in cell wall biosynthesis